MDPQAHARVGKRLWRMLRWLFSFWWLKFAYLRFIAMTSYFFEGRWLTGSNNGNGVDQGRREARKHQQASASATAAKSNFNVH
jgi:hypothetical protein